MGVGCCRLWSTLYRSVTTLYNAFTGTYYMPTFLCSWKLWLVEACCQHSVHRNFLTLILGSTEGIMQIQSPSGQHVEPKPWMLIPWKGFKRTSPLLPQPDSANGCHHMCCTRAGSTNLRRRSGFWSFNPQTLCWGFWLPQIEVQPINSSFQPTKSLWPVFAKGELPKDGTQIAKSATKSRLCFLDWGHLQFILVRPLCILSL